MKPSHFSVFLIAAMALFTGLASAEKADRDKPMNVEADAMRYDDLKQITVFSGKVVLTKGTILIRGATLDFRKDPDGTQFGVITAEPGKLAFFRQKREGLDEYFEGEGELIEYNGRTDAVKVTNNAQLRRYRGATLSDEFTGGVILYNNTTEVVSIDGAVAKPGASAPAGRVRAMLSPKPEAGASAPAPTGTPAAPALRSTTTLGGATK